MGGGRPVPESAIGSLEIHTVLKPPEGATLGPGALVPRQSRASLNPPSPTCRVEHVHTPPFTSPQGHRPHPAPDSLWELQHNPHLWGNGPGAGSAEQERSLASSPRSGSPGALVNGCLATPSPATGKGDVSRERKF